MNPGGVFWFEELEQGHSDLVGKKSASLGEMARMGLPVPPGFAISIAMYRRFAEDTGLGEEIDHYLTELGELKSRNIEVVDTASRHIQLIIEGKAIPEEIRTTIASYYNQLCRRLATPDVAVSVRSSGKESRPGMFDTYLNVVGIDDVLDKVKKVWASAYSTRAIAFRVNKDIPVAGEELGIAIPKMVNARSSGIAFTADPVTGDTSRIIIDANWGLGESTVGGTVSADKFVVAKANLATIDAVIGEKARQVTSERSGVGWEDVPLEKRSIPCLSHDEIVAIAKLAQLLEERLGAPQDMEWAIDARLPSPGSLFLLQTRPVKMAAKAPASVTDRMVDLIAKTFYRPMP